MESQRFDGDSADARDFGAVIAGGGALRVESENRALRLSVREWLAVAVLLTICLVAIPVLWQRWEPLETPSDYRVPAAASDDYWTYRRWIDRIVETDCIPILGDSFVWGEYVAASDSFSSHLSREPVTVKVGSGTKIRNGPGTDRFANAGLNGAHPLALDGLVRAYASSLVNRRVILHCNLLWMSSDDRDLRSESDVPINHPSLLPQFLPRLPAYKAPLSRRLSAVILRHVPFFQLVDHLRIRDFDGQDLPSWSIAHPDSNPLLQLGRKVPNDAADAHHIPISWTRQGLKPQDLKWVDLDDSLQWRAWRRVAECLRSRGNRLFVVIGPFNEHLLTDASRRRYRGLREKVKAWLQQAGIRYAAPEVLPSEQYGDASHPLAAGYITLARKLREEPAFWDWLTDGVRPASP